MKTDSIGSVVVRLWNAGDKEGSAMIVSRFLDSEADVTASKNGSHPLNSDEGPLLDFVKKYLDAVGFEDLLTISKKRRKELEDSKPSLYLYTGRKIGKMTPR